MYLTGIAGKRDDASAFICLRDAANRGNVFAMGHLVAYYYRHKLYTKSVETATKWERNTHARTHNETYPNGAMSLGRRVSGTGLLKKLKKLQKLQKFKNFKK